MKRATGATPLMTSISFGMFTAVWHYVANGCRAATMRGGWGGEERESNTKSWSEGGGEWAVFMVQHTD